MEKLLATYLFKHKTCPLPGVGTLQLQPGTAAAIQSDKLMQAPVPVVEFSTKETNADGLLHYISAVLSIDLTASSLTLENFCKNLLQLNSGSQVNFSDAGSFKTDENNRLYFESANVKAGFLKDLPAERIIHPEAKHNMLVGDTHTDTGAMSELLFAEEKTKRSKWVWWAIGIAAIASIIIVLYFSSQNSSGFGNANQVSPAKEPSSTYSTGSK